MCQYSSDDTKLLYVCSSSFVSLSRVSISSAYMEISQFPLTRRLALSGKPVAYECTAPPFV